MIVRVTKKGRNYTYDIINDDGDIVDQRISLVRYSLCTKNGKKYYTDISKVKEKDLPKLITITHKDHEGTN